MKFLLQGEIHFNKDATEAENEIGKFVDEANKTILLKGIPEGQEELGAKITSWNLDKHILGVIIESGNKVRSHDGILRLKKPLGELLGKKYHLGVRKLHVNSYKVTIPIGDGEYKFNLDAARALPNIHDMEIKDNAITIEIKNMDESSLRKQVANRIIKHVVIKEESNDDIIKADDDKDLTYSVVTKYIPGEIIAQSNEFKTYYEGDVTELAVKKGWIKPFPGRGQWFYGPEMTALQRAFEKVLIDRIIEKLDFQEALFPKLIPLDTMNKMKYLEGLPEGMYYCSAPKRDPEVFNRFKNEIAINREIPIDILEQGLKKPGYVMSAAQCEPFYEFLSHEVIDREDLPIKFYDKSGWTYRWESGGAKGMDRVHEFQRIELVWLGTPEQTNKIRDDTLELSHKLANDLELEWYTEIGDDPFYLEGRKIESRNIEFPEVPKYEMRLKIPDAEKGVAVVSANVHGTHFIQGFSIKEAHQDRIWTGCTGLGLTRWLFGFLAQKGFNKENWPKLILDELKEVKTPKILTWPKQD
ncbi:serine--tRNA ligase [Methanobrevibacter curvatus]|uniref:Serine--tRNA ligase n=1 Tax=Methanobrevibacter curvatus TaxID=49547 RepID=A0A166B6L9_9EURY|nr:serine--tRNA ligase [Methanobrevibacter curvatus]KZX12936.1 amino acid--[acyl-carrier-protein] ligase 1 [Methanobrevibacter curvatus]